MKKVLKKETFANFLQKFENIELYSDGLGDWGAQEYRATKKFKIYQKFIHRFHGQNAICVKNYHFLLK